MKFVIKSKKALAEAEAKSGASRSFKVKTSPQVFLALTPSDARADIGIRAVSIGEFSKEKAGNMFLMVDPKTGSIVNHSGRARSQAAINSKVSEIEIEIRIPDGHSPVAWEDLPNTFHQQEGSNTVSKDKFHPIETSSATGNEDPLEIGSSSKTFTDEILPAATLPNGYQRPAMKTKDAEQVAKAFIKAGLTRYAESVKRKLGAADLDSAIAKSGLGQNEYVEKNAQDFQEILDSKYRLTDDKGELTFNFMNERYKGKFWGRQPVGDITISKR